MSALEAGDFKRDQVRMPRRELGRPDLVVRAGRITVLPDVGNIERMRDESRPHFVSEEPVENIVVDGQRALREDRVAQLLKLFHDLVVQAGIVVINPPKHHDADTVFALKLIERFTRLTADVSLACLERLEANFEGALILFAAEAEDRPPRLVHLVGADLVVLQIEDRIEIENAILREDIALLGEGGLYRLWRRGHRRAGIRAGQVHEMAVQHVIHREPDRVERLLAVLGGKQVVNVRDADLRGITRIDRAAASSGAIQLRRGVVGVENVLGLEAEGGEVSIEERRVGVGIQQAGNADAEILAALHQRNAFLDGLAR